MKLQFVSYDNIDIIKSNLKSWVDNFKQDSSDWLQDELGNALFSDTKFAEIPDFNLDMSADKPFLTEAENDSFHFPEPSSDGRCHCPIPAWNAHSACPKQP